ncbi:hypothetical protein N7520_000001 [Penicillium odoratum]|uniref:uncharacterized protein n=1 Tax=Penicillium odoratum TaxID=1167516 RepID=UPI00254693A3|nr:uncharacterized protein N7520_000001 [Penicillium odoratum]KAJ5776755.1 hypothetical protein N7520_000001 [Penicillium odoratum]
MAAQSLTGTRCRHVCLGAHCARHRAARGVVDARVPGPGPRQPARGSEGDATGASLRQGRVVHPVGWVDLAGLGAGVGGAE